MPILKRPPNARHSDTSEQNVQKGEEDAELDSRRTGYGASVGAELFVRCLPQAPLHVTGFQQAALRFVFPLPFSAPANVFARINPAVYSRFQQHAAPESSIRPARSATSRRPYAKLPISAIKAAPVEPADVQAPDNLTWGLVPVAASSSPQDLLSAVCAIERLCALEIFGAGALLWALLPSPRLISAGPTRSSRTHTKGYLPMRLRCPCPFFPLPSFSLFSLPCPLSPPKVDRTRRHDTYKPLR